LSEDFLPVVLIRQFFFCEQIPYLNLVLHVVEPETESMVSGGERHRRFHAQYLPRSIRAARVVEGVWLKSVQLGLAGVLDVLVETVFGELVPCEFKNSALGRGRPLLKDLAQLAAYALLVEDNYGKTVKRGILFYGEDGGKYVATIDDSLRRLVLRAVDKIRRMIVEEKPPSGRSFDKCGSCWYSRVCWSGHPPNKLK